MSKMKKVLVVDDDQNMLQLLYAFLRDSYHVIMAESGKAALECLRSQKVDLILLDYLMPGMDLPALFLTGVSDSTKISECLKLDPIGYILKPIGKFSLLAKIRAYFEEMELESL